MPGERDETTGDDAVKTTLSRMTLGQRDELRAELTALESRPAAATVIE
jgi:hypothetical protein